MNQSKFRKAKDSQASASSGVDPKNLPDPQSPAEFLRRGYALYARGQFGEAIGDYKRALDRDPEMIDAAYALGMAYKADQKKEESVQTFKQVLSLLNAGAVADRVRADMLRRLALGHINEITLGDWNLEKEIWQRVE